MKIFLFVVILSFLSNYAHGQYQISAGVFGNGGVVISSAGFQISSTASQTSIGNMQSNNFNVHSGFWYPVQIVITSVDETTDIIPKEYKLEQNYPNPFNPSTLIEYQVPEISNVTLRVYDILGIEVKTLVNAENGVGNYKVNFNASNLASGVYFLRLEAKSKVSDKHFTKVGKMMLLK